MRPVNYDRKVEEVYQILKEWNIEPHQIKIDEEAVDLLLIALKNNVTAVYLDNEDGLIIEQE